MRSARPAALLVGALLVGCSGREPEPAGIGKWRFNQLTLKDVRDGKCQPTEGRDGRQLTWCFAQPPYKLAKRTAEVDAYFLGTTPDAKLIEVQLSIRGCVENELDQWLRQAFGPSVDVKGPRTFWKNSFIWIDAIMPSAPGRCVIHMLPLGETAEIARLKAES